MPSEEVTNLYNQIKEAQERLFEIRRDCSHTETYTGLYSWRPGCIDNAVMCQACDQIIEILYPENFKLVINGDDVL